MKSEQTFDLVNFDLKEFVKKNKEDVDQLLGTKIPDSLKGNECAVCFKLAWKDSEVCLQCD
jgi:hypothetical protein